MSGVEKMFGVRDADDSLGKRLREAIASRDVDALNRLVIDDHPDVLWGSYTRQLPDEDRQWMMQNLRKS